MSRLGHPSVRRLQRWLAGQDPKLEKHVTTCHHCADRLESLSIQSDGDIKEALLRVLDVPEQLPERLRTTIDQRMSRRNDLTLIGEFFTLPLQTARLMTSIDQGEDD